MDGRSDFPADPADFVSLTHGASFYGAGRRRKAFDFLLTAPPVLATAPTPASGGAEYGQLDHRRRLDALLDRLRSAGMEAIAVDLTTDELRTVGLWAVRVVIPRLMPISFVHRARYLGTPRLYTYGAEPRTITEDDINPDPLPFA
jgi:ribosomal protein S12 methylthiotransferase accessory factor